MERLTKPRSPSSLWSSFSGSGDPSKTDDSTAQIPNARFYTKSTAPPAPPNLLRSQLQEYLINCSTNADLMSVVQLGRKCLSEATESLSADSRSLVYCGAALMEWANFRGADLSPQFHRELASAHYESWLTHGIVGEVVVIKQ